MGYDIEKEKREAIEAGQRALSSLRTAKENLNSAKNWGLVDMFGGGFFSTMLKHSKMDQARQNMEQAKYDLRNFSRELHLIIFPGHKGPAHHRSKNRSQDHQKPFCTVCSLHQEGQSQILLHKKNGHHCHQKDT